MEQQYKQEFETSLKNRGYDKVGVFSAKIENGVSMELMLTSWSKPYMHLYSDLVWNSQYNQGNPTYELWGKKAEATYNSYEKNIIDRLHRQNKKGLEKYGMTLAQNKELSMNERIEHLAEELTDGLQYIEHMKSHREATQLALIESLTELTIIAGKYDDEDLMRIARGLHSIAKALS